MFRPTVSLAKKLSLHIGQLMESAQVIFSSNRSSLCHCSSVMRNFNFTKSRNPGICFIFLYKIKIQSKSTQNLLSIHWWGWYSLKMKKKFDDFRALRYWSLIKKNNSHWKYLFEKGTSPQAKRHKLSLLWLLWLSSLDNIHL